MAGSGDPVTPPASAALREDNDNMKTQQVMSPALQVPSLTESNFQTWKFLLDLSLKKRSLFCCVEDQYVKNNIDLKDDEARALILISVGPSDQDKVLYSASARDAYKKICSKYELERRQMVMASRMTLYNLKLESGGDLVDHIREIERHTAIIRNSNESVDDLCLFLNSLPREYQVVIQALKNDDKLTFEKAQSRILDFHRNDLPKENPESEKVLATQGHSDTRACFFCKKTGHLKKDCMKFKAWLKKKKEENNDADFEEKVNVSTSEMKALDSVNWYLDSGATSHMCFVYEYFLSVTSVDDIFITLADGSKVRAEGVGTVQFWSPSAKKIVVLRTLFLFLA